MNTGPIRQALTLAALALTAAPTIANGETLFQDQFTGTRLKPAWMRQTCQFTGNKQATNVCDVHAPRLDGHGHLLLPSKPTIGSVVGTFRYDGHGWPAPRNAIGASWRVPFTVSVRMKVPTDAGWAATAWLHQVDASRNVAELDFAEPRTAIPWQTEGFYHLWNATPARPAPPGAKVWDPTHWMVPGTYRFPAGRRLGDWHTYAARVGTSRTTFMVDGHAVTTAVTRTTGWHSLVLQNIPGKTGSWIAGDGTVTNPLAPARPATNVIDSVTVTRP